MNLKMCFIDTVSDFILGTINLYPNHTFLKSKKTILRFLSTYRNRW